MLIETTMWDIRLLIKERKLFSAAFFCNRTLSMVFAPASTTPFPAFFSLSIKVFMLVMVPAAELNRSAMVKSC